MATKYHAKNGVIYMSTSGSTAAIPVGGFREYTIDLSTTDVDTTEFGATNMTSVIGFPSGRGTLGGFWASDDTTLKTASASTDGTNMYIYPSSNAASKYLAVQAWVDMSLRGAVDAAVGTTANWRARGTITNNL